MQQNDMNRRQFVQSTVAAGVGVGVLGLASRTLASQDDAPAKKLNLLMLGGTGFIGPHMVEHALSRGHTVTLFNRGQTNPHLFPELETLRGNRDPNLGEGLAALKGREFDGVVDTCGSVPRWVNASGDILGENVGHYVYISSLSYYKDEAKHGLVETDAPATMDDETVEEVNGETYGPLKALCEQAATKKYGGRVANLRPGYIVGPRDAMPQRFNLWVMRMAKRKQIIAPGTPSDPVQLIDARDLAAFTIRCIEEKLTGGYNMVGPAEKATNKQMVDAIAKGVGSAPEQTWIPYDFLTEHQLNFAFIPCMPHEGDYGGFVTASNARAVKHGYTSRPIEETARDTHAWLTCDEVDSDMMLQVNGMIDSPIEDDALKAWTEK